MQISFFEEFPEGLEKVNLIDFPTKLYLAARSVKEFDQLKKKIKSKYVKEVIYWPLLSEKEGYWFSAFSNHKAMKRVLSEIHISVMIDLELPTRHNFWLYFTQLFNFFRNKKLIKHSINKNVYLAEYFPIGKFKMKVLKFLGLHFDNAKVIKMLYHSHLPFGDDLFLEELKLGVEKFGDNYLAGFGTIARGIAGNEKILSFKQLKRDLELAKKAGVKEVVIFRLGGLDKQFLKVIQNFY